LDKQINNYIRKSHLSITLMDSTKTPLSVVSSKETTIS
jgi:hypothetical protein